MPVPRGSAVALLPGSPSTRYGRPSALVVSAPMTMRPKRSEILAAATLFLVLVLLVVSCVALAIPPEGIHLPE